MPEERNFQIKEEKEDAIDSNSMDVYKNFWEQLTNENVEHYREFASPTARYRDPFGDAKGIDAFVAYVRNWFTNLDGIKFMIQGYAWNGLILYSDWIMTFRIKRFPKKLWEIKGLSKTVFNSSAKIEDKIDFWDSAPMFEYYPILGKSCTK